MIQEYDAISTPGLVYYSLKPTTVSKEVAAENVGKDIYVEKHNIDKPTIIEEPISTYSNTGEVLISNNTPIEISTQGGYFTTSHNNITIHKRTVDKIIFSIPFGINDVVITTKESGSIVKKTYKVV